MPVVHTSVGKVAYSDEGAGPPVVLLHATLHDRHDFDAILPALAAHHRVIALDWPGHGASDHPPAERPLGAPLLAEVLAEVVGLLGLPPAAFIGNSVGGFAAARLAIDRPDQVTGLVLVDTGGFTPVNALTRAYCGLLARPGLLGPLMPRIVNGYMRPRTELDRRITTEVSARIRTPSGRAVWSALWRSFARPGYDLRRLTPGLRTPALLVWGARDSVLPVRFGRLAQAALPGSRLEILDTGHVVFASAPQEFLSLVEPFLAALGDPPQQAKAAAD